MIRKMRLATAVAFGAGLMAAGAALAQTQAGSATPPAASAQPAPPPTPSALQRVQSETPAIKPADPNTNQPTYAVDPPPQGASGVYLPAAVLGYAKSAAGCVVVGCDDGPQASGSAAPSSPAASATPPPANPGSSDPH
jgi:hypothetical protein